MSRNNRLLVASALLNAVLVTAVAYLCLRQSSTETAKAVAEGDQIERSPDQPVPSMPHTSAIGSEMLSASSGPESIVAQLRTAGFSGRTLGRLASVLLEEKYIEKRNRILGRGEGPRWDNNRQKLTDEQRRALEEVTLENGRELLRLLGDDYYIGMANNLSETLGLENLEPHTAGRVAEMLRDYNAAKRLAGVRGDSELIDVKLIDDLKTVLTPDQLNNYLFYNSPEFKRLQSRLSGAPLNDMEFEAIVRQVKQLKGSYSASEQSALEMSMQYKLREALMIREATSPEVMVLLSRQDGTFSPIARIYERVDVKQDRMAEYYLAWLEFHAVTERVQASSASREETDARTKDLGAKTYRRLTEELGPKEIVAFDATPTGRFLRRYLDN